MNAFRTARNMPYKTILAAVMMILAHPLAAQLPEYNHRLVRSFAVGEGATVDIYNKYGKVQVVNWDKDSVRFVIDLRVRAKDQAKLQKLRQNVDFDFTPGVHYLVAHTRLGDKGDDVFKDLVDIAGNYLQPSTSVTIDYLVMVPQNAILRIENKFGNVYLDDPGGNLNVTLSYGNFTCNRISTKGEIRVTGGDADISYIREGQVYLSYGNLHIREAENLFTETRSANVTIDRCANLKVDSRRDRLFVNDVAVMTGQGYFTQTRTGTLQSEMNFVSRYGSLSVSLVKRGFSTLNLTAELTTVSLAFEKPLAFGFEMNHHQDLSLTYPKDMATLKTSVTNPSEKMFLTTGTFGSGKPDSNVTIHAPRKTTLVISAR